MQHPTGQERKVLRVPLPPSHHRASHLEQEERQSANLHVLPCSDGQSALAKRMLLRDEFAAKQMVDTKLDIFLFVVLISYRSGANSPNTSVKQESCPLGIKE